MFKDYIKLINYIKNKKLNKNKYNKKIYFLYNNYFIKFNNKNNLNNFILKYNNNILINNKKNKLYKLKYNYYLYNNLIIKLNYIKF